MFDIGFSELFVIAIVALLVLGPERLPKAARFAGLWVRRARAQWYSVKSELEHELAAEELKRNLRDTEQTLREAHDELKPASTRPATASSARAMPCAAASTRSMPNCGLLPQRRHGRHAETPAVATDGTRAARPDVPASTPDPQDPAPAADDATERR